MKTKEGNLMITSVDVNEALDKVQLLSSFEKILRENQNKRETSNINKA